MSNSYSNLPFPHNEPILSYSPGSPEKKQIKDELERQNKTIVEVPLVIGGEEIRTQKTEELTSPHNKKQVIAKCYLGTKKEITEAIANNCSSQKDWAAMSMTDRAGVFLKAADLLASSYRAKINAATMIGQSKTVFQAEIDAACELIDFFKFNAYFATLIEAEQPMHSPKGQWNRSVPRGLEGFVFAVGPFNFTSISLNLACAPALMGCSVLWKPSPTAMLSSYLGMKMLEEAGLPPGVINLVNGDAKEIGEIAMTHPDFAGLHFTGSTQTFNYLWHQSGANLDKYKNYPRIVGETGGKDFVFAHPSANVSNLKTALIRGAFEYQGQKCSAASRAYIPKSIWAQLKDELVAETNAIKMGDPNDFTNFMSAVIDERAFKKITGFIEHAKDSSDAEIIAGGEYDDSEGYFIRPTIIEAKKPRYKTMVEEIFGPVLTVYVYEDSDWEKMLIECDQATPYALTGAIFAQDRKVINQMTNSLAYAAGNFYVNDKPTGAVVGQQPFGGSRGSGTNDKAGSIYNLTRWVSHRTIKENFLDMPDYRYPFMAEK